MKCIAKKSVFVFSLLVFVFSLEIFSAPSLVSVEVKQIGSKTRAVIKLDEKTSYVHQQLTDPMRIIINFSDKVRTQAKEPMQFTEGYIKSIRFVILDNPATKDTGISDLDAVIIELADNSKLEIIENENDVMVDVFSKDETQSSEGAVPQDLDSQAQIKQLLESANNNYKNEYFLLAKADCQSALSIEPSNEEANELLKKIDNQIDRDLNKAEDLAEKISKEKSKELNVQKEEAKELSDVLAVETSDVVDREAAFSDFVKTGKTLFKKKRYDEALEVWERALELKPGNEEVTSLLANVREKIKIRNEKGAETAVSEEVMSEVESLLKQGEEQFANLDYSLAITTFENILNIDPNNLQAMRYLAQAKRNQATYVEEGGQAEDVVAKPLTSSENLGMLTLDDSVKIGVANHLPTKIAQEEVLLAKTKTSEAKRALFPKMKIKYKETSGTTTGEDFEGQEYGAELQQNIWAGGKYRKLYNQARVNLAVARKNYEKTKAEFTFEVTQAYYNLAFAKVKMKNKIELNKKVQELLDIAEKQYNAKALTLSEILEARSQMEEVKFQTAEIENDLELANLALAQLLSLPTTTAFNTIEIPDPVIFEIKPEQLLEVGYKNDREYQVKKLLVLFQKYGVEIAKKKNGFNVELTGSYGQRDEYYVSEQVDLKDEYYVGLKVSKPLGPHVVELNGLTQDKVPQIGQTTSSTYDSAEMAVKLWETPQKTDIAEANIAYHKAISELENTKRTLVHDIYSSYYSVKEAQVKIKNKSAEVSLGEEELRSTRAKQKVEQATIVQVMRGETKYWNGKTDLISAQADYYVSIAKLNKNLGVNDYFDPISGVISTDKEDLSPGVRLKIQDKDYKRPWYKSAFSGVDSYYPDDVVTDILKESQDKGVMGKDKFLGIFGKKDDEFAEYKAYDEKYDFSTPLEKEKGKGAFTTGGLNDDFSGFYSTDKEYELAFGTAKKKEKEEVKKEIQSFTTEQQEKDYFENYLKEKDKIIFAEYHVEENQYETVIAIRSNAQVTYTVNKLANPDRIVISIKDVVISALNDYADIAKGSVVSMKAYHTKAVLPSKYKDWKRLLSLIVELNKESEYSIESNDQIFKIIIKK
ncbi:MAG: Outer membrane efflux protein [uncultured bacterium]|nr:MAG: Outer membrane efflux protein [uncultured bacterium]